jgi:hypothetical protein
VFANCIAKIKKQRWHFAKGVAKWFANPVANIRRNAFKEKCLKEKY